MNLKATSNHPLDNPVWFALSETHAEFAIADGHAKFYQPRYCPFGGCYPDGQIADALATYAQLIPNFFIVGTRPQIPAGLQLVRELICDQMMIEKRIAVDNDKVLTELNDSHAAALYNLVNLVQPGYFRPDTRRLGTYFGIFENRELVAVTGERMKMNDYTEVSAVVTHPQHSGKGYAKRLVAHVVNRIFDQGKTPILHVAETNLGAIRLYEKLGFTLRRKISLWNIST